MKFSASLLLLSALGVGGGTNPPIVSDDVPSQEARAAGTSYPAPTQNARPITPAPPEVEAMLPIAGDEGLRATSNATETRYDEVGMASWYGEELGPNALTASGMRFDPARPIAAHKTLPLGSFVEVTALDSGRTILLEVADRGPHRAGRLIDLSRGAAQQLGTHARSVAPVRVRQVSPSAQEIAALRLGTLAPARLDAPEILLAALRKRLPGKAAAPAPVAPERPSAAAPRSVAAPVPAAAVAPVTPTAATAGRYHVQVATFSTQDRARALAAKIAGTAAPSGRFFRVQLGPFATRADADRARDRVAGQGYGDARVVAAE